MSNDIRLFQLSNYVRPKLEENKSKNWVLNGRNNSFYQYIIDRFNGSPTNAAIISSYIDLIYGQGLSAKNKNLTAWINFKVILNKKELRKIISDFELFGEASMQVIKDKKGDLSAIYHLPKQLVVPALENEDGEIETYWYSKDWSNTSKYPPVEFRAFGTSKEAIEIYCIKPYKAGKNYFSDPDYLSALPYAEMEEELANFYINSIKKGLSAGYIINVPNGISWTPEEKDEFEKKIKAKLTGSPNAMSFVLSFNGQEAEVTIVPFPVNEQQHKQWEYLTGESRQQIMTGHKVVSPKLFGIMSDGGLGNNANELDEAEGQLMKRVIAPKQAYILEALEDILSFYNIGLDLYFIPLSEKSVQLSADKKKKIELEEYGEFENLDEYELIDVKPVNYDEEITLATTGTANPLNKSRYDLFDTITRYRYAGRGVGERDFCKKMIGAKKIYRIEDIELMSKNAVNAGFGPEGATNYDIFKYKGGVNCHHYWEKLTYKRKNESVKVDVKSPIAIDKANQQHAKGLAGVEPINMPNRGALN